MDRVDTVARREGGLDYLYPDPPQPGEVLAVGPGVWWLRMPLPFALDHINLWLLEDGDGWTIVDTGISRPEVRELWIRPFAGIMAGRPVKRVLVTHYHPDHMGLAHWLTERFEVPLWTSQAEFLTAHLVHARGAGFAADRLAAHYRAHGLDAVRIEALMARGNTYAAGVPELPAAFVRLREHALLDIGDHRWRVMVGHGHAPEHISLYCEELGIFIAGDQVLPRISTNVAVWATEPDGDPLADYLATLERFRSLPADTLGLPSHGLVFRGLRSRLQQLRDHHRERLDELLACCHRGVTAADMLPVLFRRKLDTTGVFFAMGEAIAHLNHLWWRGDVERVTDAEGVYRFARPGSGGDPYGSVSGQKMEGVPV